MCLIERIVGLRCIGDDRKGIQLLQRIPIGEALIGIRICNTGKDRSAHGRMSQIVDREHGPLGLLRLHDLLDRRHGVVHFITERKVAESSDSGVDREGLECSIRPQKQLAKRLDRFLKGVPLCRIRRTQRCDRVRLGVGGGLDQQFRTRLAVTRIDGLNEFLDSQRIDNKGDGVGIAAFREAGERQAGDERLAFDEHGNGRSMDT